MLLLIGLKVGQDFSANHKAQRRKTKAIFLTNDVVLFDRCSLGPVAESPKSSPASISTLKEKIKSPFGKGKAENTRKIQLMLEETLTKNVQLQRVRKLKILRVKWISLDEKLCCMLFFPYNIYLFIFVSMQHTVLYIIVNAQAVLFSICLQDVDAMSKELQKLKQQEARKPEEEMQQPEANHPEVN